MFFYSDNSLISALWVAMSASFPVGETEFIHSVQLFSDQVTDPKLQQELKEFTAQEAHHSLQHRKINKMFDELGYSTAKIEALFKEQMVERRQKWSPEKRLARTVVAEHVTAVMAHFALTHADSMAQFPDSLRKLFQWHAIEEIELLSAIIVRKDLKQGFLQCRNVSDYDIPLDFNDKLTTFFFHQMHDGRVRLKGLFKIVEVARHIG